MGSNTQSDILECELIVRDVVIREIAPRETNSAPRRHSALSKTGYSVAINAEHTTGGNSTALHSTEVIRLENRISPQANAKNSNRRLKSMIDGPISVRGLLRTISPHCLT